MDSIVVLFPLTDKRDHDFKMKETFLGSSSVNASFDLHNKGNQIYFHRQISSLINN